TWTIWDGARPIGHLQPIVTLRVRDTPAVDATGVLTLEDCARKLHESDRTLILCGARPQPAELLEQAEFEHHVIGRGNICPNIRAALERAKVVISAHTVRRAA